MSREAYWVGLNPLVVRLFSRVLTAKMMTASRVKVTVQLVSHIGPTHIKVWRKPGMRCPLIVKPDGRWGKKKSPVTVDVWVCPVTVPILNFGAKRSMLTIGEYVEK